MQRSHLPLSTGRPASDYFALVAGFFLLAFTGLVLWLSVDQRKLINSMDGVQAHTLPKALEQQRLARNLEVIRLSGERVLYNPDAGTRRQARYLVSMLTEHPSMQEHPATQALVKEVERFIRGVPDQYPPSTPSAQAWEKLSRELVYTADRVSVEGVNLITQDINDMESVINKTNHKLLVVIALALVTMLGMVVLISRVFIEPLKMIDRALHELPASGHELKLPKSQTSEIQTINHAIVQLHKTMQENETIRAGLEVMASTDGLTGLMNRRHFMEIAQTELVRAQRYQRHVLVGLADLDHFKSINDEHGHSAGDKVLREVATFMRQTLRQTDLVCRYGGEEFAFVFNELSKEEALWVAERLRMGLESLTIELEQGKSVSVTISVGVVDASTLSLEAALSKADDALYQAKAHGRNRVEVAQV